MKSKSLFEIKRIKLIYKQVFYREYFKIAWYKRQREKPFPIF